MKLLATFCAFVLGQWILPPNYGYIHATIIGVGALFVVGKDLRERLKRIEKRLSDIEKEKKP